MKHHIILMAALLLLPSLAFTVSAQLHEEITVEGRYMPDVIPMERINRLPEAARFAMPETPPVYETAGQVTPFRPVCTLLPATLWRADRPSIPGRGYAELTLGSYLNGNLSAGYKIVDTRHSALGVALQYNNSTLFHPDNYAIRRICDGTGSLYGYHNFKNGTLAAQAYYGCGWYNYYMVPGDTPTQTTQQGGGAISWTGSGAVDYTLRASAHYLGYRRLYTLATQAPGIN